ncbi:MAG: methyltransferase domain-containing protein [Erythrobacter sp.]|uniref:class I SAM-dependent methyltransferase n=1 Tax=Erythrobacter sp. TaxID=1042 RepID=UPI00260C6C5B|nr:class I SAM-dependent methyltransferase [Erythrobacter sp.]MDJ0979206.1 methyltransferase domain-containing protein [Erythrobacter sp.]
MLRELRSYVSVLSKLGSPQTVQEMALSGGAWRKADAMECPYCGYVGPFASSGVMLMPKSCCPKCGSLPRHRLFRLIDADFAGKDLLHFAPEGIVKDWLGSVGLASYRTADLFRTDVDLNLNVEDLDLPSQSVDMILFFHVLEHVDDRKALPELFRVLRPGGTLFAMFPIVEGWSQTYENPEMVTDKEREIAFGQSDHVRFYGRDVRDRIRDAGFEIEEFTAGPVESPRYGLERGEKVFECKRPPDSDPHTKGVPQ